MTVIQRPTTAKKFFSGFIVFVLLMVFWIIFSGHFDMTHITYGIISCSLVSYFSGDLLFKDVLFSHLPKMTDRFIRYIPWLIWQVIIANFHVVKLVLNPKSLEPHIIKYRLDVEEELSLVTFANSVTLTPGTITMDIDDNHIYVHALSKKVAEDLNTRVMESRVSYIFDEK